MRKPTNPSLTISEVAAIKRRLLEGASSRQLASVYEVGLQTIRRIARGETWADVEPEVGSRTIEEQADKVLGTELAPRNDAAMLTAQARFEQLLKTGNLGPVMPVAKGTADRAAMFGAHRQTVEQMNQGEIKGDSDNE